MDEEPPPPPPPEEAGGGGAHNGAPAQLAPGLPDQRPFLVWVEGLPEAAAAPDSTFWARELAEPCEAAWPAAFLKGQ